MVITEFMANPSEVNDSAGEWFEVYNPGSSAVDLNGWQIKDATGSHTISTAVSVGPGQYKVLGINTNTTTNGGVNVAYDYGSMGLTNSGDTISLYNKAGNAVDTVSYTSSWAITSGASLSLKDPSLDNSVSSNWCVETAPWTGSAGDKGTPGQPAACGSPPPPPPKDSGPPPPPKDSAPPPPPKDSAPPPPPPPPGAITVAAVQYGNNLYSAAPGCSDDTCAVSYFVTKAAQQGATYVVTPEGALDQPYYESCPQIGVKPHQSSTWTSSMVMHKMAALADQLNITVIFNAYTAIGSNYYNTFVAVDKNGTVVGLHHKYHLFANEGQTLTAGTNCVSTFQTPAGKAGLLICADIQCTPYLVWGTSQSSCEPIDFTCMPAYKNAGLHITFWGAMFFTSASSSTHWKPKNMQADFAKYSGTYFVAANQIHGTNLKYRGGGIFKPDGSIISWYDSTTPGFAIGTIPKATP